MTKELTVASKRIFSLELPDPLKNVDEACNLMHDFLLTLVEAKKMRTDRKNVSGPEESQFDLLRIHISYYERG